MHVNLALIAERDRREADRLEEALCHPSVANIQASAPFFLRQRAARYEQAQQEMAEWKPPLVPTLDPRPTRRLLFTAAILGGIGVGLLAYIFMAVHP
jgi:hypothetical protein